MDKSLATMAQYFRIGIEAGICQDDQARDWAFAMISKLDEPQGARQAHVFQRQSGAGAWNKSSITLIPGAGRSGAAAHR